MYINLYKSKLNNKDLENMKFSNGEMKYMNSSEIDYDLISGTLTKREKKPKIFSHIFLLITQKIKSNFKSITFYFLQFILPVLITIITCYIGNSLTNNTPHLMLTNINSFTKFYKLYIPIFYEKLQNDSSNKEILDILLEDFVDGKFTYNNLEKNKTENDSCCRQNETNVCFVNSLKRDEFDFCDKKFPIIHHRNYDYSINLIKECNSNQYLHYTRFNHIYEQFNL